MKQQYFDMNNNEIKEGMYIKHIDGDIEEIHASEDDLGLNASNENHTSFDPLYREIYPLYQFDLREWVIVEND